MPRKLACVKMLLPPLFVIRKCKKELKCLAHTHTHTGDKKTLFCEYCKMNNLDQNISLSINLTVE